MIKMLSEELSLKLRAFYLKKIDFLLDFKKELLRNGKVR